MENKTDLKNRYNEGKKIKSGDEEKSELRRKLCMGDERKLQTGQRLYDLTKHLKDQRQFLRDVMGRSNPFITSVFYGKSALSSADLVVLSLVMDVSTDYLLGLDDERGDVLGLRIYDLEKKVDRIIKHLGVKDEEQDDS